MRETNVRSRTGYVPLRAEDEAPSARVEDARFDMPPDDIPWGAVGLAFFLAVFGICAFVLAWLHFTQQLFGKEQAEIGFTVVGLLTFIPGAYHSWIAYCVWRGVPGYRWSDIPQ